MIYCRMAPSLGALEDMPENIWGTPSYNPELHINESCVFFGLYGLPDFYALWRHKGKKYILWAGSDITHFKNGYWLDETGDIRLKSQSLARWINKNCEVYVENQVEQKELQTLGIALSIKPSFLGRVEDYELSYTQSDKPKVYTSVSGDNFELYKWHEIYALSDKNPNIEFHLYGNEKRWLPRNNIVVHGRVPKEQMNEEIKQMQGALRLLPFDGFSEIIAKSILWGQWPISAIKYQYMLSVGELEVLKDKKEANIEGREYYRKTLNDFLWNLK